MEMSEMGKRLTRKQKRKAAKMTDKKNPSNFKTTTKTTWKPKTTHVSKASCHTGQLLVFTTDTGIQVYGGGKNRAGGWHKLNFIPDLAMGPDETLVYSVKSNDGTEVPDGWLCGQFVGKADAPPPIIALDFPDFGIPKVGVEFWHALVGDIKTKGIKTISTQCAGGHGRTGVQLCILYDLLNTHEHGTPYSNAGELIQLIRDLYCVHAVETKDQQKYIADVCGIPVGEIKIEDRWGGATWHGYGGGGLGKVTPTVGITTYEDDLDGYKYIGANEVCGHCGKISFFQDNESYCEVCLEPYKKTDDDDDGDCPSCDSPHGLTEDGKSCDECGWHKPNKNDEPILCYSSGNTFPPHHFTFEHPEASIQSIAEEWRIKHDKDGVECFDCGEVKDNEFIHSWSDKDKGFICRKCY